jgi:hypothetical protein
MFPLMAWSISTGLRMLSTQSMKPLRIRRLLFPVTVWKVKKRMSAKPSRTHITSRKLGTVFVICAYHQPTVRSVVPTVSVRFAITLMSSSPM